MGAGLYSDRLQWLQCERSLDASTGQMVDRFRENGHLWCSVERDSGQRSRDYGADRPGVAATVRVRNWPSVRAVDRLRDDATGEVWILESLQFGDNELVAEAHAYDDLDDTREV
jgi:head-tail adaptor